MTKNKIQNKCFLKNTLKHHPHPPTWPPIPLSNVAQRFTHIRHEFVDYSHSEFLGFFYITWYHLINIAKGGGGRAWILAGTFVCRYAYAFVVKFTFFRQITIFLPSWSSSG